MPKWLAPFQDPDEPVPPARTSYECRMIQSAEVTQCALEGIAHVTRVIAQLSPSDNETYALMLGLRQQYADSAKLYIKRVLGG